MQGGQDTRPKSAGIMSSLTGSNRQSNGQSSSGAQQQQASGGLSYGNLRSRFLNGGGNGNSQKAEQQQGGKSTSASKLFSISR
jgi:hypothetical protein